MNDPAFRDIFGDFGYSFVLIILLVEIVIVLGLCAGFGAIALHMAKSRGLRTVPAFFAGFFGCYIALFFIAMFPKKDLAEKQGTEVTPPPSA